MLEKAPIDQTVEYIKKATKFLPVETEKDKQNLEYFQSIPGYVNTAYTMVDFEDTNDKINQEKYAYLRDAVTRWATQITFLLFRQKLLSDELDAEFRALDNVDNTTDAYRAFDDARTEKGKALEAKRNTLVAEQKIVDLFKAVVGGMEPEEAKKKQEEYERQLAESL